MDGAAYMPKGVPEFCEKMNIDHEEVLSRYQLVIHLESLASARPDEYGAQGNDNRFEDVAEAQRLEQRTREAWEAHSSTVFIEGTEDVEDKLDSVTRSISSALKIGDVSHRNKAQEKWEELATLCEQAGLKTPHKPPAQGGKIWKQIVCMKRQTKEQS